MFVALVVGLGSQIEVAMAFPLDKEGEKSVDVWLPDSSGTFDSTTLADWSSSTALAR
jgi:hypothetical protein